MFMHAGILHLAGNMVYLFLFGACVEDFIGRARFAAFYLLCGLASAFAEISITPGHFASEIPLVGASGAVSGCIGGFLLLLARTKIEFKWVLFFWFRIWSGEFFLPAWLVISFWFLEDFGGMILKAALNAERGGVAFAAHVGGTLIGLGLISLEKLRLKHQHEEQDGEEEEPTKTVAKPTIRARPKLSPVPVAMETPTIYLFVAGSQTGPFTLLQIQQMFDSGTIPADALYWQEGMEDWSTAEELRQPGVA